MFCVTTELLIRKVQLLTFSPFNKFTDPKYNGSVQHFRKYFSTFTKKKNFNFHKEEKPGG